MSQEAEHSLLTALMLAKDESEALCVADSVDLSWLTCEATAAFIGAMQATNSRDMGTLFLHLKDHGAFQNNCPKLWIAESVDASYGTIRKADAYLRPIIESHQERRREQLAKRILRDKGDRQKCALHIAAIEDLVVSDEPKQMADGYLNRMDERLRGEFGDRVPSHLTTVDDFAPLELGHTCIIAALTGNGKTTYALNAARAAADQGHGALILSLEMRRLDLCDRLVASEAQVNLAKVRDPRTADNDERQRIRKAVSKIDELPIHVVDAFETTPSGIAAQCRKQHRRHPFNLLVIDYLQLINPDMRASNRSGEVASVSRGMKTLANELNVALLLVSQLNRQGYDGQPQLNHLKESASIEHDASTVLFLHQPKKQSFGTPPIEVLIAKNRSGPSHKKVDADFIRETCTFRPAKP